MPKKISAFLPGLTMMKVQLQYRLAGAQVMQLAVLAANQYCQVKISFTPDSWCIYVKLSFL